MAKFRTCDYNQMNILPVSIDNQISPYTLEFIIHNITEDLDLSYFNIRYNNDNIGRKAINPKVLLKIILLGYSRGLTSSRDLEKACRENAVFMAMTCGDIPDHSTIATFVSTMEEEIAQIFTQILIICDEEGLIGGTHFSIDGVKLPSNASKECSGKLDELKTRKEKIEKKVKEIIKEHNDEDKSSKPKNDGSHEKRLKRLKQKAEKIDKFLEENGPRIGTSGKEVQSNTTDNESAKMVGSHGMVLQGYNANAFVDGKDQVITYAEAFGENEDSAHIEPMLEGAKRNLEQVGHKEPLEGKIISADSGYHSTESLKVCEEYEVDAYIPDKGFRKRDERLQGSEKYKRATNRRKTNHRKGKGLFTVKDFIFNDKGRLTCPAGAALYIRNRNFETKQGLKGINYQAPKTACRNCELKRKCLRKQTTVSRQVHIFEKIPGNITDRMKEKIDSPHGRKTYGKRLGIVEPVFANIRARKKMNRFTLRGKVKVNIQWKLFCMVHNLEKIVNFGNSFAFATQ